MFALYQLLDNPDNTYNSVKKKSDSNLQFMEEIVSLYPNNVWNLISKNGDADILRLLFEKYSKDYCISKINNSFRNAVSEGHLECVKICLEYGADIYSLNNAALEIAITEGYGVENIEVQKLLIVYYPRDVVLKLDLKPEVLNYYLRIDNALRRFQRKILEYIYRPSGNIAINTRKSFNEKLNKNEKLNDDEKLNENEKLNYSEKLKHSYDYTDFDKMYGIYDPEKLYTFYDDDENNIRNFNIVRKVKRR
jgi:hypothetical protein